MTSAAQIPTPKVNKATFLFLKTIERIMVMIYIYIYISIYRERSAINTLHPLKALSNTSEYQIRVNNVLGPRVKFLGGKFGKADD